MSSLKTRAISVQGMTCADCEKKLRDSIRQLEGVQEVNADCRTGVVTVSYDLLKADLSAIEQELGKSGFDLKQGMWGRLKRGWTHYTEQNERDNMTAGSPPCCSSPDSPHPKTHG